MVLHLDGGVVSYPGSVESDRIFYIVGNFMIFPSIFLLEMDR